jgi:hypothetical protein
MIRCPANFSARKRTYWTSISKGSSSAKCYNAKSGDSAIHLIIGTTLARQDNDGEEEMRMSSTTWLNGPKNWTMRPMGTDVINQIRIKDLSIKN